MNNVNEESIFETYLNLSITIRTFIKDIPMQYNQHVDRIHRGNRLPKIVRDQLPRGRR